MLGHDQQRIRLALALTMALPDTPFLMYGDEIGMGEDLSLPGRIAVRDPMQWSPRARRRLLRRLPAVPANPRGRPRRLPHRQRARPASRPRLAVLLGR